MDHGKRSNKFYGARSNKIYMDFRDIIREHALPFLPAKSLFRFRKVCKDWKFQISTPFFAHSQSISCTKVSGLYVRNPGHPPLFISFDPESCGLPDPSLKFLPVPVDVKCSSNGLLCCQGVIGNKPYYICNPVTQQWKELPKSDIDHGDDSVLVLVYQPSLLNFVTEYKLVCAFRSRDFDDAIEFDIYSSKEGLWKASSEISFAMKKFMPKWGIDASEIIYFPGPEVCLAFDLTNERSYTVAGYDRCFLLGMVDGKLCSACIHGLDIYVVEVDNTEYLGKMLWGGPEYKSISSSSKAKGIKRRVSLDKKVIGNYSSGSVRFLSNTVVVQCGESMYSCDLYSGETKRLSSPITLSPGKCIPYVNSLTSL